MPGNGVPKLVILTLGTAFKPALGEVYKSTHFAPKFAYLRSKSKIFSGGTERASPDPSPHPTSFGAFGAQILATSALELGAVAVTPFAYPGTPQFGSHITSFFKKRPLTAQMKYTFIPEILKI